VTESTRYLQELRRALPRRLRRRVVRELRQHFHDGIAAEVAGGLDRDDAERLTIERLGPPERVAAQFAADAPPARNRTRLVLSAALIVLIALAIAASAVVTHTQHAKPAPAPSTAVYVSPTASPVASSLVVLVRQVAARQLNARAHGTPVVPRVIFMPSR
jgi:hypothetical protein